MNNYNKVLVAVDLSEHANTLLSRAKSITSTNEAQLHLAYCIEPLQYQFFGEFPVDLTGVQAEIEKSAQEKLQALGAEHGIDPQHIHLFIGNLQDEMCEFIKKENITLLLVGKHHKHGIALLFGSTGESLLSRTTCDVLSINVDPH